MRRLTKQEKMDKAFWKAIHECDPEAVMAARDAGADVEARQEDGQTGLMYAAENGDINTVRLLLDAGADVNARRVGGLTALRAACEGRL